MDPALHHVLIAHFLCFPFSSRVTWSPFVCDLHLALHICPFPLLFPFLRLIVIPPRASRIYIPLPTPQNPPSTSPHLHSLPIGLRFPDEHGFFILFCPYFDLPLYIVSGSCCSYFCLSLVPSLSPDISLLYSSSSIGFGIFVHSLPFLYYFTILFGALPRLVYWAGWVSGLVDLSDCNISPTAIGPLHIHLSRIILLNTNP